MPSLKYALVGAAGGIARTHLDSLGRMPDAQLTALVDLNEAAGRARADAVGAAFFTDHRAMLREIRPDVVVVVTRKNKLARGPTRICIYARFLGRSWTRGRS